MFFSNITILFISSFIIYFDFENIKKFLTERRKIFILNHYNDYMENTIITRREMNVINKKFNNHRLSQLDSNVLTRSIRPKLRQIMEIDAGNLLKRLDYNVNSIHIEEKIRKAVMGNVNNVVAIIVIGSAVQTSYRAYNDIDVIVVTKNKIWGNESERNKIIDNMEKIGKKEEIKLDIQIISKKALLGQYPTNPSLIYQLKDCKIILGDIKIPNKINMPKLYLKMKLDWSDPYEGIKGREIYECIRNTWLVRLLMSKVVDNYRLSGVLANDLGNYLLERLKNNKESLIERKFALSYLNSLIKETENKLKEAKWEKIVL